MGFHSPEMPFSHPAFLPKISVIILKFSKETCYSIMNQLLTSMKEYILKHGGFEIFRNFNVLGHWSFPKVRDHLLAFYTLSY